MKRTLIFALLFVTAAFAFQQQPADKPPDKPDDRPPVTPRCPQGVTRPVAVFTPDPDPPSAWSGQRKSGTVTVKVKIDRKGKLSNVTLVRSTDEKITKNVLDTVKGWRFRPARCGSEPVETEIVIEVNVKTY